jgi:hypothetical protein
MPESAVRSVFGEARVESYAGYKGEESPRAVVFDGKRFEIVSILSRERALDLAGGEMRETWRCRLDDGRTVVVEHLENDIWRVYPAI